MNNFSFFEQIYLLLGGHQSSSQIYYTFACNVLKELMQHYH